MRCMCSSRDHKFFMASVLEVSFKNMYLKKRESHCYNSETQGCDKSDLARHGFKSLRVANTINSLRDIPREPYIDNIAMIVA